MRGFGLLVAIAGTLLYLWARDYVGTHPLEGVALLFGVKSSTYSLAIVAYKYGPWMIGLGLLAVLWSYAGGTPIDVGRRRATGDDESAAEDGHQSGFDGPTRSAKGARASSRPTVSPEIAAKRETLKARIQVDPLNPRLFESYGDLLAEIESTSDALLNYLRAIELEPKNPTLQMKAARAYAALGNGADTAKYALHAVEQAPDSENVVAQAAELLAKVGRGTTMEPVLRRALDAAPLSLSLLRAYRDLCALGSSDVRRSELIRICERIVAIAPEDHETWKLLADSLQKAGRSAEAAAAYERVLTRDGNDGAALLVVAIEAHDREQDYAKAETLLTNAIAAGNLEPRAAQTAQSLLASSVLAQGNRASEAKSLLDAVAILYLPKERHQLVADCYSKIATDLLSHRQDDLAEVCLRAALKFADRPDLRRTYSELHRRRGEALAAKRNFRESLEAYDLALESAPDDTAIREARKRVAMNRARSRAVVGAAAALVLAAGVAFLLFYPGRLQVTVQSDAVLALEGSGGPVNSWKTVGKGPVGPTSEASLRKGTYRLRATGPGLVAWDSTITVQTARTTRIVVPNLSNTGAWYVTSNVPASVTVDGKLRGATPLMVAGLPIGFRSLELAAPGYVTVTQSRNVVRGQNHTLHFELHPAAGTVVRAETTARDAPVQRAATERQDADRVEAELEAVREQQRLAQMEVDRQLLERTASIREILVGRWYYDRNPAKQRANQIKAEGSYVEIERVEEDGRLYGAIIQPNSPDVPRMAISGTVDGETIRLIIEFAREGITRQWDARLDTAAMRIAGPIRTIRGPGNWSNNWSASKR